MSQSALTFKQYTSNGTTIDKPSFLNPKDGLIATIQAETLAFDKYKKKSKLFQKEIVKNKPYNLRISSKSPAQKSSSSEEKSFKKTKQDRDHSLLSS